MAEGVPSGEDEVPKIGAVVGEGSLVTVGCAIGVAKMVSAGDNEEIETGPGVEAGATLSTDGWGTGGAVGVSTGVAEEGLEAGPIVVVVTGVTLGEGSLVEDG